MRTLVTFGAWLSLTAALSFAATDHNSMNEPTEYRGHLLDTVCVSRNPGGEKSWVKCAPTATTSRFTIYTSGKLRMLDTRGNVKAGVALQHGELTLDKDGDMSVILMGRERHKTIVVESIRAHKSDTSVH
jgi:hypothetical protein